MDNEKQKLKPQDFFDARKRRQDSKQDLTIPIDSLDTPSQPLAVPDTPKITQPSIDSFITPTQLEKDTATQATARSEKAQADLFEGLFGGPSEETQRIRLEEQSGLGDLRSIDQDLANEQFQTTQRFERERRDITNQGGLTSAQKNARLNDVSRQQNFELADIAVRKFVASNDLSNAQAAVDRKLDAQFADQKRKVDGLKFIADNYEGKEKKALEAVAKKEERAFAQAFDEAKNIESLKLEFLRNGGDANKLAGKNFQTVDETLAVVGNTLGAKARRDAYKDSLEVAKLNAEIGNLDAEKAGQQYNPDVEFKVGTPNNVVAWMQKSAGSKKLIDQSQRENIEAGLRSVSSVENLNSILFDGEDPLSTGRVRGKWRNLQAKAAEDISTKQFESLVIGLVPTAARGLFGEVGVLTDNDVNRYKQTMASATNTQEENAAIQNILMDVASKQIGLTLETAARSGQNVSGFSGRYIDTIDRIEKQKEFIGQAEISKETNDSLFSLPTETTNSPEFTQIGTQAGLEFISNFVTR